MKPYAINSVSCGLAITAIALALSPVAQAETITIGKGTGIV